MAEVAFTEMKAGTPADYQLLAELEQQHIASLPDRILQSLYLFAVGPSGFLGRYLLRDLRPRVGQTATVN